MGIGRADSSTTIGEPSGPRTSPPSVGTIQAREWLSSGRFGVLRRLGQGGMGVVHEAFDRERGHPVALKSLLHFSPDTLYRFKQEFRTLADVHHRNLVRLYELVVAEEDHVFFTMELVRGTDFLTYVQEPEAPREEPAKSSVAVAAAAQAVAEVSRAGDRPTTERPSREPAPADFDRLREAFRQLVEGVMALHAAGKLHRDIKPSNVLVAEDGRVVILDFGVAIDFRKVAGGESPGHEVVGTFRYMAPEQALSDSPTPASDWYSVGVVLYEALTGRTPFSGTAGEVISAKALQDPVPPAECVEGVPPELDSLCRALLDREEDKRPTGLEILRRLGPVRSRRPSPVPAEDSTQPTLLVGRERHLAALREGFERILSGQTVTVRIAGGSGMGKSAIAQHFLDGLVERGEALVLRGRAYERESVPYKAVDSVVDALSRFLVLRKEQGAPIVLPADMGALARVFPVLRRVVRIGEFADSGDANPSVLRRRAFSVLRELLRTLAKQQPLVLFIDDVHWGDGDSAALLLQLVRPPDAPSVLFLMTHREEEAKASSFLRELRDGWPRDAQERDISVGPLDAADAERLALALFDRADEAALSAAREVARESRGSPFLIEELVRSPGSAWGPSGGASGTVLSLGDMVAQRLARLPDESRMLVEVVAVGGRPLPVSVVAQATGTGDSVDKALTDARTRRVLRTGMRDGREVVETSHDRFRETIVAQLSESKLREHHGRLARVLEATPGADPEAVAVHLLGAGETERGGSFAEKAAAQAVKLLAFDQAARLFRLAIETSARGSQTGSLHTRLGEVLGWAGRHEEASRAYITAAEQASGGPRLALERAASAQLIAAGRIDDGVRMLRRVLGGVGVAAPQSPLALRLGMAAYKMRLMLGRLRFKEREASKIPAADLARLDTLHVVSLGLASVDFALSMFMQTRQLLEAMRVGDRTRVLRAATLYFGSYLSNRGGSDHAHDRDVSALIDRLLQEGGKPEEAGFARAMRGLRLFLRGQWREALATLDSAYVDLPGQLAGMQSQAQLYAVYAQLFLGDLAEVRRRTTRILADAEQRGDLFMPVFLTVSNTFMLSLADDEPESARTAIRDAKARWSHGKFLTQDWQVMRSEAEVELYTGAGAAAYARLARDERAVKQSLLLRIQFIRVQTTFVRARAAVASTDGAPELRTVRLAEARKLGRALRRERMKWVEPLAAIVDACVRNAEGDRPGAMAALQHAVSLAIAADMPLYAEAARHQLAGLLEEVDRARALRQDAEDAMRARDIRAPARFASMLVPGTWTVARRALE
jgi:serine/threonine protein kinase